MNKVTWLRGAVVVATALAGIAVGAVSAQALTGGVESSRDADIHNAKERYRETE